MKKIKNNIINIFKSKEIYIFLGITLIFFGTFFSVQYAPDTYFVFNNSAKTVALHFFSCGRIVTGIFIYTIVGILKLSNQSLYIISYLIALIAMAFSILKLYKLLKEELNNKIISGLCAILIIINIFSIELFMYIEKGIMMISILLSILAVEQTKKFLEGNKKSIIYSAILMLIANCCYQGTVGIYIALSMIYILKYSKNIQNFIKSNIEVALVYGIPAIINLVFIKIFFSNSRIKGEICLAESIKKIIEGTINMFKTSYGLFPKHLYIAILIVLSIYIVYKIIKKQEIIKNKIIEVLGVGYILLGTIIVTVLPQILQATNSIWFVARTTYPVASIIGILIIYLFMIYKPTTNDKNIIIVGSLIFLIVQFTYFIDFEIDNYKVNFEDMIIAKQINEKIEEYEEKSGKRIEKISYYNDKNPCYSYQNIKTSGDMNIKAFSTQWSTIDILKYYTKKDKLEEIEKQEEKQEYFNKKDWVTFNEEQIIFENDIIHICNF